MRENDWAALQPAFAHLVYVDLHMTAPPAGDQGTGFTRSGDLE